jgi:hypothetical protein
MIRFNAAPEFDFDEWATLAQRDPQAFEARRRALLAIEVARGGGHAGVAKAMLERLETRLAGKAPAERARLSMLVMAACAKRMTDRLGELAECLREYDALQDAARRR